MKVPPVWVRTAPDAITTEPLELPVPFSRSVPLATVSVPLLVNVLENRAMPVPVVRVIAPVLVRGTAIWLVLPVTIIVPALVSEPRLPTPTLEMVPLPSNVRVAPEAIDRPRPRGSAPVRTEMVAVAPEATVVVTVVPPVIDGLPDIVSDEVTVRSAGPVMNSRRRSARRPGWCRPG